MISDRAKAIAALSTEIDALQHQANMLNNEYASLKEKYLNDIKTLSGRHNVILDSICAMEEAISKIIIV